MEEERIPKKNFNGEFHTIRSVRNPREMRYRMYVYEAEGADLGL
jgi:hypothetical protein